MSWARFAGAVLVLGGVVPACGDAGDSGGFGGSNGSGAGNGSGATGSGATGSGATGGSISWGGQGAGQGTGGGPNPDAGCATSQGQASLVPPALMLVVDTSGSMGDPPPGGSASKWSITRTALGSAVQAMPSSNHVGLYFYPGANNPFGSCIDTVVEVGLGPLDAAQLQRLGQALQAASPLGGTPTHDAYMVGLQTANAYPVTTNKFVVLLTDGVPTYALNCNGTGADEISQQAQDAMVNQVQMAAGGGIRTFIIGAPGSEGARDTLSRMASAGGTAPPGCSDAGPNYCHFDMTTQPDLSAALNAALSQIAGQALTCTFDIPPPPTGETLDLNRVSVWYTPSGGGAAEEFRKDDTCAGGWSYSQDQRQINLCGADCDRVKADPSGRVDVIFGCEPRVE